MSSELQTCETCPFSKKGTDYTVCIGGEAVPDLVSVALNYESGAANDVLYAIPTGSDSGKKVFIAQVDGSFILANEAKKNIIDATSVCEGPKGKIFKRCSAGLIAMSSARPKDGFEGFIFSKTDRKF